MAAPSTSERDLELDKAVAEKAERGERLTAGEARRLKALEARWQRALRGLFAGLEAYAKAGIVERTDGGGYRVFRDGVEAELQELEHRRRRRPSRVPFEVAVIRRVREARRQVNTGGDDVTRRPRPRGAGRPRGDRRRSPGGGRNGGGGGGDDGGGESDPPLAAKPTCRLTAARRERLKRQVDAAVRARVKREEKLGLPNGIDRTLYCANGHPRAIYERVVIYPSRPAGKKECVACKADRDALRSPSSKPSYWLPVLALRQVLSAGVFVEDQLGVLEPYGELAGDQWGV